MKNIRRYNIQVLSRYSLFKPEDYLRLVKWQVDAMPDLLPQKWDCIEPIKRLFDPENLSQLIPSANPTKMESLYWKRGKPKVSGMWHPMFRSKEEFGHAFFSIDLFNSKYCSQLISFLEGCYTQTKVCFGYIDAPTTSYYPLALGNGWAGGDYLFLTTHVLVHYLPDMPWAAVFGSEYIQLFGRERILSAPIYEVKELDAETIYCQLTKNIADLYNDFEMVQQQREAAKRHLGYDCFYQKELGYKWDRNRNNQSGPPYRVPKFSIIDEDVVYKAASQR